MKYTKEEIDKSIEESKKTHNLEELARRMENGCKVIAVASGIAYRAHKDALRLRDEHHDALFVEALDMFVKAEQSLTVSLTNMVSAYGKIEAIRLHVEIEDKLNELTK